jgi:hypothetical protein
MNTECIGRAIEQAKRTYEHVYIVVPDERLSAVLTETSALLYGHAASSGRTWLFPDEPTHKGGKLSVVPVSEEPPAHAFTLAPCAWGVADARPISKWRSKATGEVSWA